MLFRTLVRTINSIRHERRKKYGKYQSNFHVDPHVLNLGMVDGKAVEKSVSINNLDNEVTPETVNAVVAALESLLEYPVTETKQYETGLLTE